MGTVERLVVVVLFDRVDLLDVTGPPEVFALLQREMDEATGITWCWPRRPWIR